MLWASSLEAMQDVTTVSRTEAFLNPSSVLRDSMKPLSIYGDEAGLIVCKIQACRGLFEENAYDVDATTSGKMNWNVTNVTASTTPYFFRVKSSVPASASERSAAIQAS